jgi:hypothetical protein
MASPPRRRLVVGNVSMKKNAAGIEIALLGAGGWFGEAAMVRART